MGTTFSRSGSALCIVNTERIPTRFDLSQRGQIGYFSHGSRNRMRKYLGASCALYQNMCTLTYPFSYPTNGAVCKEHLRRFAQELMRYATRHKLVCAGRYDIDGTPSEFAGSSVFWFLEFQNRGAPHFHLFTNFEVPKDFISETWYRICATDDERHLRAGTRIEKLREGNEGAAAYAAKYAQKADQKQVPVEFSQCGRFWGVYGDRRAVAAATHISDCFKSNSAVKEVLNTVKKMLMHDLVKGNLKQVAKTDRVTVYRATNAMGMSRIGLYMATLRTIKQSLWEDISELDNEWGELCQ